MNKAFIIALGAMIIAATGVQAENLRICKPAELERNGNWEATCLKLLQQENKENGFLLTGSSPIQEQTEYNKLASEQTEFAAGQDGRNLYLAVRCYDSRGKNLTARCAETDGPVWNDDCIEIFIAPQYKGKDYFQFIVNPLGTKYDGRGTDREWGCEWKAKVLHEGNAWTAICAIPLDAIGIRCDGGAMAGFNICRSRHAGDLKEFSSWSYAAKGFHNTDEFGVLAIGNPKLSLGNFMKMCKERRDRLLFKPDEMRNEGSASLKKTANRIKLLQSEIDAKLAKAEQPGSSFEELANISSQVNGLLNEYESQCQEYRNRTTVVKATLWL